VSTPPACPPKAQDWFVHAWGQVTKQNLGPHFNALLTAWTRIESACKFDNTGPGIPSHPKRPAQVGRWITGARGKRKTKGLHVTNTDEYVVGWHIWWDSMQPKWRTKESDGKTWETGGAYGKDWELLSAWGQNGMLSVVACLYFWGLAVMDASDKVGAWEVAVNDAAWVCEGLATFHESFKKRR
ncbi:hypothetical protein C8R43DRAFT_872285, partial [Mycena crocata]